jgi:xanthine/CO dehydrogenase XdhC/CoxF family maturation factor
MSELQAILEAFAQAQYKGETTFLATVVNTKGSTYRRSGAKMLMTNTGRIVGAISGGCLENDIFEHTRQRMQSVESLVVTYDTSVDEDIVWGFGLGCNGVVQVLIERLDAISEMNPITFLARCLGEKQRGVLATVFNVDSVNVKLGSHLMLDANGTVTSNIDVIDLRQAIASDAQKNLDCQQSTREKYQLSSGSVEVFLELIQPPTPLIIFGAGSDAIPVANFAKALGWNVTIVDCRANEATRDHFSMADEIVLTRREILCKQVTVAADSIAVVMTHNYFDDLEILKMLLPSSARYIGVLGAKNRTEGILDNLIYTKDQLERLYFPIGIDLGAETPQEIAIAIVAEIQAVLSHRPASFLKYRQTPIHVLPFSI